MYLQMPACELDERLLVKEQSSMITPRGVRSFILCQHVLLSTSSGVFVTLPFILRDIRIEKKTPNSHKTRGFTTRPLRRSLKK